MRLISTACILLLTMGPAITVRARDIAIYPIGTPRIVNGLKVVAEYFQPIDLSGAMMQPAAGRDIHLEIDIRATANDPDGYADGEWRPYLNVTYRLAKLPDGQVVSGALMPLVSYGGSAGASVGHPHYGDNLKLAGPGRYALEVLVAPPSGQYGAQGSFAPFTIKYDFIYAGVGKKGAY